MISPWLNSTLHLTVLVKLADGVCLGSGGGSRFGFEGRRGGFFVDLEGGADFIDPLAAIADSTESSLFLLVVESDDASQSWGVVEGNS